MKRLLITFCTFTLLLNPVAGLAATVAPNVLELSSEVGEMLESSVTIFNTGVSEQTYFLDLLSFEPSGEDGTPLFTPEKDKESVFLSWFQFPVREVPVPALSKVDVPFSIVVPDDVTAGSYYGAITVATTPTDVVASNGAIVEAKTAVLVFLTVEGETVEKLELLDFTVDQSGSTLPFGTFHYRLQNQGNVHLTPTGTVKLVGLFGQELATIDANETEGRVLPASTRTYEVTFGRGDMHWLDRAGYQLRHLLIGPVRAELTISYGESGSIKATQTMQIVPVELMLALVGALGLMFLVYKKLPKR